MFFFDFFFWTCRWNLPLSMHHGGRGLVRLEERILRQFLYHFFIWRLTFWRFPLWLQAWLLDSIVEDWPSLSKVSSSIIPSRTNDICASIKGLTFPFALKSFLSLFLLWRRTLLQFFDMCFRPYDNYFKKFQSLFIIKF